VTGRIYRLTATDGTTRASRVPGTLGGHRRTRIYGRLDCRPALRAIERGGYVRDRVFFADEPAARAAGYRPCAVCLPRAYAAWKAGA
jgi:methylphosphotriester-DNA--protein-cysteine methyltransferase